MTGLRVFVSGPIRLGRVSDNINRALVWASWLRKQGFNVYCPHANFFWEIMSQAGSEQDWMDHDLAWLEVCDAVFRVDGESAGADLEIERARALGIPVFHEHNPDAILEWAAKREEEPPWDPPDSF